MVENSEISVTGEKGGSKTGHEPKRKYDQVIFRDWCKACGICIEFCPQDVVGRGKDGEPVIEKPELCIGCRYCEFRCPDFAITIVERDEEQ